MGSHKTRMVKQLFIKRRLRYAWSAQTLNLPVPHVANANVLMFSREESQIMPINTLPFSLFLMEDCYGGWCFNVAPFPYKCGSDNHCLHSFSMLHNKLLVISLQGVTSAGRYQYSPYAEL